MYQRKCEGVGPDGSKQFRLKILVDIDWSDVNDSMIPADIRYSHSIINNVCIVVLRDGNV